MEDLRNEPSRQELPRQNGTSLDATAQNTTPPDTTQEDDTARLLPAWFDGWAGVRNYRTSFIAGAAAAFRADRSGDWEYFLSDPGHDALAAVAAVAVQSSRRAVSVLGPNVQRYINEAKSSNLVLASDSERMMRTHLAQTDPTSVVASHLKLATAQVSSGCDAGSAVVVVSVTIHSRQTGQAVASGKVGVNGSYAVFDQIETDPHWRRQGLGRLVMHTLSSEARKASARTGLLLASVEGQALYSSLGWDTVCPVTVLVPAPQ